MSDSQTAWKVIWQHAAKTPTPDAPFEIDEVVPAVAAALGAPEDKARHLISGLLVELSRLPDGRQFFTREGNAVVPLPEFTRVAGRVDNPVEVYPYEL